MKSTFFLRENHYLYADRSIGLSSSLGIACFTCGRCCEEVCDEGAEGVRYTDYAVIETQYRLFFYFQK